MGKGLKRGLIFGLIATALVAIYVWVRHRPDTIASYAEQLSNSLFQIGLILLIFGVVIFTRLFSFRRRYNLPAIIPKGKTPEDHKEMVAEDLEKNEKDKVELAEKGRDATFLFAALVTIIISILLTINQIL
ncbi:hypothetical protein CIG75_02455 [Tumebacillus algifaecis]|uniref:DUF3899 domain-containing protein n=1 Tax=Tumebacillus algifaecis TaxID=1214604 RepID=A0A223CXX4_9BACL|nr:hypothetical protein [Tumebacillus algifaecis]ASS73953.1 hypothetical protein CIG75_02455 [Tumebacillus algifaecis]